MENNDFRSLLQSLVSHWQQSAKAYTEYMQNGKKFRYAEMLKVHNTAAKNLLTDNITIIPDDLKKDSEAIIEHYTIWSAKWDELKNELDPAPDDEFVFENDHRFPKAAAQKLEAALHDLNEVASIDDFGSSAAHYDRFFGPLYFEPFAIEVAKRIDPGSVSIVLEIAAGTGRVTRHIRERIPAAAKLIASDISGEMLNEAKKKLSHLDIEWQLIDAQQLPFSDNSIDLAVCCFAYMFVPDKPKAFAEAYRVLKPGGMFLFTTWDKLEENAASYTSRSIAMEYLDEPLPASADQATSMSNEAEIKQLLQDAGFSKMTIEKVKQTGVSPSAKEAAYGFVEGGGIIYEKIKQHNPASIAEIKIKLERELAEKFGAAPMIVPISAVVSEAWK